MDILHYITLAVQELVAIGMILAVPVTAPIKIVLGLLSENLGNFITGIF